MVTFRKQWLRYLQLKLENAVRVSHPLLCQGLEQITPSVPFSRSLSCFLGCTLVLLLMLMF